MIRSETKRLYDRMKNFEKDVLFSLEHADLNVVSAFIDHKNKVRRAIIIIEQGAHLNKIKPIVTRYFGDVPYKIIKREGYPTGTSLLRNGSAVRHNQHNGWGTIGGFFKRDNDPQNTYGLSNNHVIARLNHANTGDLVVTAGNVGAGTLFNFILLEPPPALNHMDAALFRINRDHRYRWSPRRPVGTVGPQINYHVYKKGLASNVTTGLIKAYPGKVKVMLNGQPFWFTNVMAIRGDNGHFSQAGDSGAMVLTRNHYMIGLLFAKYAQYSYALPISPVKALL